ncbi:MAG: negative regulator of flagellin synthesis FlgM [Planctomycetota bacterium]|jgi:negative regulator of flagellin synthesis FlgM
MINEVKSAQLAAIQKIGTSQQADSKDSQIHHGDRSEKHSSAGPAKEVSLTDTAAKLQRLEAQIANQPVIDAQRVESVKKAIADGSFKIDSNRIVEKMAEFENLLASKAEK